METFGEIIKLAREQNELLLRHVAAKMDIDQAVVSKIERGERKPTKEQVIRFSKFYKLNEEKLIVAWLSDKVAYEIQDEDYAQKALKVAEEKIKYFKKVKN